MRSESRALGQERLRLLKTVATLIYGLETSDWPLGANDRPLTHLGHHWPVPSPEEEEKDPGLSKRIEQDKLGSSKRDLLAFPEAVKDGIGIALSVAQFGGKHPAAKPWRGEGPGVLEVVEDHDGDTYRAVYTVRFSQAVYVLHCFQKKSHKGT
jgi:phage-related protein